MYNEALGLDGMEEGEVTSECSSGCESGWTVYFQQSREGPCSPVLKKEREEEEEDPSMVSDASSGPPQQLGEDSDSCDSHGCGGDAHTFCCCRSSTSPAAVAANGGKRRKVEGEHHEQQVQQHRGGGCDPLDDTASSSYSIIPKTNMNLAVVGSAPDFLGLTLLKEERSTWEKQHVLSYLTTPTSAKPVSSISSVTQKRCREDASENDH